MKPIIRALAAVSLGLVALAGTAARGDEGSHHLVPVSSSDYGSRGERPDRREGFEVRRDRDGDRERRRHDLEAARERVYASWDGNRRARERFEVWYSARCSELCG